MNGYAYGAIIAQALFWIFWRLKIGRVSVGSAVVLAIINAQYLLVEFDINGYSLRVYIAIIGALIFAVPKMGLAFTRLGNAGLAVIGLGILEGLWRFILAARFGSESGMGGVGQWASNWLVPLLYFCVIIVSLKTDDDLKLVGFCMISHIVLNAVFGVLQWLDVPQAWAITGEFRPVTATYRVERLFSEAISRGYAPGLQGFSVALSYLTLIGFVALALYWLKAFDARRRLPALLLGALALTCLAGSVAALSRSSCYLSVAFLCFLVIRGRSQVHYKVAVIVLTICAVGIGLTTLAQSDVNADQARQWSTTRLMAVSDSTRAEGWLYVIGEIVKHPIIPAAAQSDAQLLEVSPHNHMLNALYYGGLFSAVLQLFLLYAIYKVIRSWLLDAKRISKFALLDAQYRSQAAAWCLLAYFLKGLAHNDSFATGGCLGWIILAYFIANVSLMSDRAIANRILRAPQNRIRNLGGLR